ncbi:MAG: protein translocase subunit SecD [Tenericutes bacterium]|nr:protein translocase subunit SecD [Mycoplasmatota bacterium]
MEKLYKAIIGVVVIVVLCAILIKPTLNKINYGIDLQGGFEILYKIEPINPNESLKENDLTNTYNAIVGRIDSLGVSEPVITLEGNNLIRIQLPGVSNEDEARKRISTTAVLTFRDVNDNLLATSEILGNGGASVSQNPQSFQYQVKLDIKDTSTFYNITKSISQKTNNENMMIVWLDFNDLLDSYENEKTTCGKDANMKCISAASVKEGLNSESVVIEGSFTKEEAQELADLINSGSLPTKLTEEATPKSVSPSFGEEVIVKTGIAGLVTFIIISLILIFKYRISGLIGSVTLLVYAILVFITFNAVGGVLTLPGIAALVLGIGMAVDSIIISNERVKYEFLKGNGLTKSFKEGNKSSLIAIIDANITTLLAGIILYMFGESSVKGFALMLIITIFITVFTTVLLYRILLKSFVVTKVFNNKETLLYGKATEHKKHDYIKLSKYPIIISLIIIIVGVIFVFAKGFNFGVDFTGGTNINISSKEEIDFDKINEIVKEYDVVEYNHYLGDKKSGYIKLNDILDETSEIKIKNKLKEMGIQTSVNEISTLVTNTLTENAIRSLVYSLIAIIIYVAIRFNMNYAISGILMLLHDVFIILAIFAIFNIRVDFIIVASLLTIIGYSINDTIVVFDKIRENRKKMFRNRKKLTDEELRELVNVSSSVTINRNIWTSITTVVAVITLLFVGLNDLLTFNIAILIGLIAGAISSLLIGPTVWLYLEKRKMNQPEEDDDDEVQELKVKGVNS